MGEMILSLISDEFKKSFLEGVFVVDCLEFRLVQNGVDNPKIYTSDGYIHVSPESGAEARLIIPRAEDNPYNPFSDAIEAINIQSGTIFSESRYYKLTAIDLIGKPNAAKPAGQSPAPAFDRPRLIQLKAELLVLHQLAPQARGYAFEKLLCNVFNVYGLAAREPFRLQGEQIDGSFQLSNETYLLEAKWQGEQTGVADLHTFHGKLEQKAAWTRGLFISNSGFTEDGLAAFGRGKRVICMDDLDLHDTMHREIPLNLVLDRKVRRAAETGFPFARVRDLFPT
jgi:hypothetical protein